MKEKKVFLPPGKEVEALDGRVWFWLSGQHFIDGCDGADLTTADDVGQVFAHLEADEASASLFAQLPGPHHEPESDHVLVGVAVGVRLLAYDSLTLASG